MRFGAASVRCHGFQVIGVEVTKQYRDFLLEWMTYTDAVGVRFRASVQLEAGRLFVVVPDHGFTREELQAAQPRYSLTSSVPRLEQVDVFLGKDLVACVLNLLRVEVATDDAKLLVLDLLGQRPEISFAEGECGVEIGNAVFCALTMPEEGTTAYEEVASVMVMLDCDENGMAFLVKDFERAREGLRCKFLALIAGAFDGEGCLVWIANGS